MSRRRRQEPRPSRQRPEAHDDRALRRLAGGHLGDGRRRGTGRRRATAGGPPVTLRGLPGVRRLRRRRPSSARRAPRRADARPRPAGEEVGRSGSTVPAGGAWCASCSPSWPRRSSPSPCRHWCSATSSRPRPTPPATSERSPWRTASACWWSSSARPAPGRCSRWPRVLAGALVITAIIDLVDGQVPLLGETQHLPEVLSVLLVWLLAVPVTAAQLASGAPTSVRAAAHRHRRLRPPARRTRRLSRRTPVRRWLKAVGALRAVGRDPAVRPHRSRPPARSRAPPTWAASGLALEPQLVGALATGVERRRLAERGGDRRGQGVHVDLAGAAPAHHAVLVEQDEGRPRRHAVGRRRPRRSGCRP